MDTRISTRRSTLPSQRIGGGAGAASNGRFAAPRVAHRSAFQRRQSSLIGIKRADIHCIKSQTAAIASLRAFDTLHVYVVRILSRRAFDTYVTALLCLPFCPVSVRSRVKTDFGKRQGKAGSFKQHEALPTEPIRAQKKAGNPQTGPKEGRKC